MSLCRFNARNFLTNNGRGGFVLSSSPGVGSGGFDQRELQRQHDRITPPIYLHRLGVDFIAALTHCQMAFFVHLAMDSAWIGYYVTILEKNSPLR